MKKAGGAFGAPTPLPGQQGYKQRESVKMVEEMTKMEERLMKLRGQMSAEKERRDSETKIGGSRWRSSRTDRGSVTRYGKDVVEKTERKNSSSAKGGPYLLGKTERGNSAGSINIGINDNNNSNSIQLSVDSANSITSKSVVPAAAAAGGGGGGSSSNSSSTYTFNRSTNSTKISPLRKPITTTSPISTAIRKKDINNNIINNTPVIRTSPVIKTIAGGAGAESPASQSARSTDSEQSRYTARSDNKGGDRAMEKVHVCCIKRIDNWTVKETLEWLALLNLPQYQNVFATNEISGPILLEVGLDDLDYMQITILAHRKLILKGIEDLKRLGIVTGLVNGKIPQQHQQQVQLQVQHQHQHHQQSESSSIRSNVSSREDGKVHWSYIKPISAIPVSSSANNNEVSSMAINLAEGHYDEHAAHQDFVDAVNEWRRAGKIQSQATSDDADADKHLPDPPTTQAVNRGSKQAQSSPPLESGMWRNPFLNDEYKEAGLERSWNNAEEKDEGVRKGPQKTKTVGGVVIERSSVNSSSAIDYHNSGSTGQGTTGVRKKNDDILDEAAEHEAFRRAVEEWRSAGKPKNETVIPGAVGGGGGEGSAGAGDNQNNNDVYGPPGALLESTSARTRQVAERLAKQMDEQHEKEARDLERRRQELQRQLEAAQRTAAEETERIHSTCGTFGLNNCKNNDENGNQQRHSTEDDEEDDDNNDGEAKTSIGGMYDGGFDDGEDEQSQYDDDDEGNEDDDANYYMAHNHHHPSTSSDDEAEEREQQTKEARLTAYGALSRQLEISVLETSMGYTPRDGPATARSRSARQNSEGLDRSIGEEEENDDGQPMDYIVEEA